jgi:hypothetical protein
VKGESLSASIPSHTIRVICGTLHASEAPHFGGCLNHGLRVESKLA